MLFCRVFVAEPTRVCGRMPSSFVEFLTSRRILLYRNVSFVFDSANIMTSACFHRSWKWDMSSYPGGFRTFLSCSLLRFSLRIAETSSVLRRDNCLLDHLIVVIFVHALVILQMLWTFPVRWRPFIVVCSPSTPQDFLKIPDTSFLLFYVFLPSLVVDQQPS